MVYRLAIAKFSPAVGYILDRGMEKGEKEERLTHLNGAQR